VRQRQAPAFVIVLAASLLAAGGATADPSSVAGKQAQARQVLAQIQGIDASLERAVEAYDAASSKLQAVESSLRQNRKDLRTARSNLVHAQGALSDRLVSIYTAGEDQSTLSILLGSSSLDDMLNRLETVNSVSSQDARVISEVTSFKAAVKRHERELERARVEQQRQVAARAAERSRIQSQLASRRQLLSSIKGQIAQMQRAEQVRQLQIAAAARSRLSRPDPVQQAAAANAVVGASASTPEASVAAPSSHGGGVVGIAMRYLGVPYVWGGASPSGFDCSGLVAYVYAQVGVSLPHYTGAQYAVGVPVSRDQLEPGDLVFFNGLGHVGIYIGGGQMIHAPHTGDVVKISNINSGWYAATYVGARRIP
jgi:cell wall-associated NlpC family hydrolase